MLIRDSKKICEPYTNQHSVLHHFVHTINHNYLESVLFTTYLVFVINHDFFLATNNIFTVLPTEIVLVNIYSIYPINRNIRKGQIHNLWFVSTLRFKMLVKCVVVCAVLMCLVAVITSKVFASIF